jgi:hypothetical protein
VPSLFRSAALTGSHLNRSEGAIDSGPAVVDATGDISATCQTLQRPRRRGLNWMQSWSRRRRSVRLPDNFGAEERGNHALKGMPEPAGS